MRACSFFSRRHTFRSPQTDSKVDSGPFFKPALQINIHPSSDVYELEADHVANEVIQGKSIPVKKATNDNKNESQKENSQTAVHSNEDILDQSISSGNFLSAEIRRPFEKKMGADFSTVKIHTDQQATVFNNELNAKAFTTGKDIFFKAGNFSPETKQGKQLLAHELSHIVQQQHSHTPVVQRKIEVETGVDLNMMGFTHTKSGNTYSCPKVVKNSVWNEIFTALLHSPRVFKILGKTNAQADANLLAHMVARMGVIQFAAKKKYVFGAGSAFRVNPKYWNPPANTGPWQLKEGMNQQEALNDINVHPKEYALACYAATLATMVGGAQSNYTGANSSDITDWVPGDWGYIRNNKFKGPIGMEGENIIYVGKDSFWGHLDDVLTYHSLDEWFKEVKGWNGDAEILDSRRFPIKGLDA